MTTPVNAPLWRNSLALGTVAGVLLGVGLAAAERAQLTIDQITDFSASSASGMFRFAPDMIRIAPGETVTFLNSRGSHTVKTQKGFWPEGVDPVDIAGQTRADVVFDQPGLYGVTCARHGKYGMVMLVAVGDVAPTDEDIARVASLPAGDRAKAGYLRLLEDLRG
ncbi:MAG: plastocyanin/azurin family copper-binding protein [Pseudomonadota bacterium]